MTLTRCIAESWHWVERDLLALGLRADDIGTPKLTLWELVSIVVASPPGSACYMKVGNWSRTDELLANLGEQQAGVMQLNGRYSRPGVDGSQVRSNAQGFKPLMGVTFQPMDPDTFVQKRREYMVRNQRAAQQNPEAAARKAQQRRIIPKQGGG